MGELGFVAVITTLLFALVGASLSIPDRKQAAESPPSGWCGETAIQEALLHVGIWASQRAIHKAGNSKHPDLYSNELPKALASLGVQTTTYAPKAGSYAAWVREAIDAGDPVIAGVKILPTDHPSWGLDHFVLVVGYGESGFLTNTTWGKQQWASEMTTKGISFAKAFYGIRVRSIALPKSAHVARLKVLDETATTVKLAVECVGAASGAKLRVTKDGVGADSPVTVDAESIVHFACVHG